MDKLVADCRELRYDSDTQLVKFHEIVNAAVRAQFELYTVNKIRGSHIEQ